MDPLVEEGLFPVEEVDPLREKCLFPGDHIWDQVDLDMKAEICLINVTNP